MFGNVSIELQVQLSNVFSVCTVSLTLVTSTQNYQNFASFNLRTNFSVPDISQEYDKRLKEANSMRHLREAISFVISQQINQYKIPPIGMGMNNFGA